MANKLSMVQFSVLFGLFSCCGSVSSNAFAADPPDRQLDYLKENIVDPLGLEREVYLKVPGKIEQWDNLNECGDATHCPANGGVFFTYAHSHCPAIIFKCDALDEMLFPLQYQVTAAMLDAFYDKLKGFPSAANADPQVTKEGSVDTTHNCHAYATGRTTHAIDDATLLYLLDFELAGGNPALSDVGAMATSFNPTHSWKVTDVYAPGSGAIVIKQTKEKVKSSAVYIGTYKSPGLTPNSSTMIRKTP